MSKSTSLHSNLPRPLPSLYKPAKKRTKTAASKQQKQSNYSVQSSEVIPPSPKSKSLLRKTFIIFSKVQDNLNLRRTTLFLAFEIFSHSYVKSQLRWISQEELQCTCLYLAMKYEEIYPLRLSQLQKTIGCNIEINRYRKLQQELLKSLDYNINFKMVNRQVEQLMGESNHPQLMMAAYLLQLAIACSGIYTRFSREKIVKAVALLTKRKYTESVNQELTKIIKLLLIAKSNIHKIQPSIFTKYEQSKYAGVSLLPL